MAKTAKSRKPVIGGMRATRIRFERSKYRPIAVEVGWIAYEWNRLQEVLAGLFSEVTQPLLRYVAFAIWHSTPNDRAQREMLRAAVEVVLADTGRHAGMSKQKRDPRLRGDLLWLLKEANTLADHRNTAIHSPFNFVYNSAVDLDVRPHTEFLNPRAARLEGKDLVEEFVWYRQRLELLANFAEDVYYAIRASNWPWPQRPTTSKMKHGDRPRNRA